MRFGVFAWTAAWLAGCASGSGYLPPSDTPGAPFRQAATLMFAPNATTASFTVSVVDFISVSGEFKSVAGQLVLGSNGQPQKVEVDMAAESADAGSDMVNEILLGPRFFDAKVHPRVTFRSAKMAAEGDRLSSVEGDLMLRGISKPVTLKVNRFDCRKAASDDGDQRSRCFGEASANVKRTDFGMSSWLDSVGESIKIDIRFTAFVQP